MKDCFAPMALAMTVGFAPMALAMTVGFALTALAMTCHGRTSSSL